MSYQRVNYVTDKGAQSSAYYEPITGDGWDVYTRAPVELILDSTTGLYSEWVPPVQIRRNADKPKPVIIKPYVTVWMLIPVGFFAVGMFWLSQTYLH